ncbi:MAG: type II toxin-antitoxin system Phd/YefM family antitoxin [Actinomycetota bacterium]
MSCSSPPRLRRTGSKPDAKGDRQAGGVARGSPSLLRPPANQSKLSGLNRSASPASCASSLAGLQREVPIKRIWSWKPSDEDGVAGFNSPQPVQRACSCTCATVSLMGDHIGLREMRQQASELVRRVEAGEEIVVTVSGRPAARLVPVRKMRWRKGREIGTIFNLPTDPAWPADHAARSELFSAAPKDPWTGQV